MEYLIELKEERYKPRQTTFLHLLTGFTFTGTGACAYLLGNADWVKTVFHAPLLPVYIPAGIGMIYGLFTLGCVFLRSAWLRNPSVNKRIRSLHIVIALLMTGIFALSQWWLAAAITGIIGIANLFAYFYEQQQGKAVFVCFTEELIQLPATARRKQLLWTEVDRVLLRHGNITIDCTNNFLYQWTIRHNDTDPGPFEAFCGEMIDRNRDKRVADNW